MTTRQLLQASPVNRDCRAGYVLSGVTCKPHDQRSDGIRLDPGPAICAGHGIAIRWRINGAWKYDIGSDAVLLVFESYGSNQRNESGFRKTVGADAGAGIFGSTAADADDPAIASAAHVWDYCPEKVKSASQIQIQHFLEGCVIRLADCLPAGEAADQKGENINSAKAG